LALVRDVDCEQAMPFHLSLDRPSLTLASSGSFFVARFGATTVADLDDMLKAQLEVIKRHGHLTTLSLVPISTETTKVSDEVKQKSVQVTRALGKQQRGSATVVLGTGLGATIIRTFMTGFNLLAKNPFPQKTFSDPHEAHAWLSALPQQDDDVKKANVVELLRVLNLASKAKAA
jgi:hypothetical protein